MPIYFTRGPGSRHGLPVIDESAHRVNYYAQGNERQVGGVSLVAHSNCKLHKMSSKLTDYGKTVGGLAVEGALVQSGDSPIERAHVKLFEGHHSNQGPVAIANTENSSLVRAFQKSPFFSKTTEQLKKAGRNGDVTTYSEYGQRAYKVRAHAPLPWEER